MGPTFGFVEATREQILIKMALCGPPGGGKTRSALGIATELAKILDLGDIYFIDSENRSSSKYARDPRTGKGFKFKALHIPKDDYSPQTYMKAIHLAEDAGAKIIIIDSLSHAWEGVNGILEQVDRLTEASRSRNAFSEGWKKATPIQRRFVQTMLDSPAHVIVTMRSDPEWVVQEDDRGKKSPTMIGLSPKQRKDISFEWDIVVDLNRDHTGVVSKSRCEELNENNGIWSFPGENVARVLANWVGTSVQLDGAPSPEPRKAPTLAEVIDAAAGIALEADGADRGTKARAWDEAKGKVERYCRQAGIAPETGVDTLKARIGALKSQGPGSANGAAHPGQAQ